LPVAYGYEIWSLVLRGGTRLRVVLREKAVPQRGK
jgi:hypothetical protein